MAEPPAAAAASPELEVSASFDPANVVIGFDTEGEADLDMPSVEEEREEIGDFRALSCSSASF